MMHSKHLVRLMPLTIVAALLLAATPAVQAQSGDITVSNVKYANTLQLANTALLLNGAGVRYKAVFKVYTAGLYLTAMAGTTEAVLATPGPKRIRVVMLRDIDGSELGKLFTRGIEQNMAREEFSKLVPGILRMSDVFAAKKKLAAGENFSLDWIPGNGAQIVINGVAQGEPIKEPEFYAAVLRIWLGNSPADSLLKDALLGKAPAVDPFR